MRTHINFLHPFQAACPLGGIGYTEPGLTTAVVIPIFGIREGTMQESLKQKVRAKIRQVVRKLAIKYRWLYTVYAWLQLPGEWVLTRKTQQNYKKIIKELSVREDKINVVFLVSQSTKWNGDSLYQKLDADCRFVPIILYAPFLQEHANLDSNHSAECRFFIEQGYNFSAVSSVAEFWTHKPDIVFYQQPWDALGGGFAPVKVSQRALCLYFPYSVATSIENPTTWYYCSTFFKTLYRHFVFNTAVVEQFQTKGIYNTIATGYPKMDVYLTPIKTEPWKDTKKFKIVYAPHHSFEATRGLWATFDWNGRELLEWAKAHADTEWTFKPHPTFRHMIFETGRMTEAEIGEYYDEWNKLGSVYTLGNYFDIFRTADLLITDCGSFLTEWLPTEKPCIHLLSDKEVPNCRSFVHEASSRHYYKVKCLEELNAILEMLVVRREDPLAEVRIQDARNIPLDSAKNIYHWLVETLWGEKEKIL